jgi:hypothetical protein
MDIPICLNRLGVKPEILTLSDSVPPHTIVRWEGGDPQPTEAELQAAWDAYQAEGGTEMIELRSKRNQLLTETDWWAASDRTMTDEQTAYRQALRDLPANTTDPANPVWPTKP